MRMDAYYYGFRPTGCEPIDKILSAVATAGEAFHHTEDWNETMSHYGKSPVQLIQEAADAAARELESGIQRLTDLGLQSSHKEPSNG